MVLPPFLHKSSWYIINPTAMPNISDYILAKFIRCFYPTRQKTWIYNRILYFRSMNAAEPGNTQHVRYYVSLHLNNRIFLLYTYIINKVITISLKVFKSFYDFLCLTIYIPNYYVYMY